MTEDEAKTRWCPFARGETGQGSGINRIWDDHDPTPQHCLCIASACMAWHASRRGPHYFVTYKDQPEAEYIWNPLAPEHANAVKDPQNYKVRIVHDQTGYCGL